MEFLLRMLGTLIGVALVMLLLSLLVTSVVQFLQSLLQLRSRNLAHSLAALLDRVLSLQPANDGTDPDSGHSPEKKAPVVRMKKTAALPEPAPPHEAPAPPSHPITPSAASLRALRVRKEGPPEAAETANFLAKDALEWANFTPPDGGPFASLCRRLFSPEYSWIQLPELQAYLKRQGLNLGAPQLEWLDRLFPRMEAYSSKRFLLHVRLLTFLVAVAVTAVFQVSTIELFQRLSTDPALRAQFVDAARGVVSSERVAKKVNAPLELATEKALQELQERHQDDATLRAALEPVSGEVDSRAEALEELRLALKDLPEEKVDRLAEEYAALIDEIAVKQRDEALEDIGFYTGQLAALDLKPLSRSGQFYLQPANFLGMCITAVLLTLGAPFWFELLKNMLKLHDLLQPKRSDAK